MASRKNRTAIGAIAFILLLGLTFVLLDQRDKPTAEDAGLPNVNMPETSITELQITRPNEEPTVLGKIDGRWSVTAPIEAKADQTAVNATVRLLSETSVKTIVATKPEHYQRLEVDPSQAVHVAVRYGGGEVTELDVGKYANGYTMARVNDSETVYGLDGELLSSLDRSLDRWRDTKIVDANSASVSQIAYDTDHGRFNFVRDTEVIEEIVWKQAEGGEPIEDFDAQRVGGFVSTVANLRAIGFAAKGVDASEAGLEPPIGTIALTASPVTNSLAVRPGELPDEDEDTAEPQTIVIEIGGPAKEERQFYIRRRGNDDIYIITGHTHGRLRPTKKSFQVRDDTSSPAAGPNAQQIPSQLPQQ